MTTTHSTTMALAVASLFVSACKKEETKTPEATATPASGSEKIKCFGVNECSAQAACDVPDGRVAEGSVGHACGGQNECKGKGWLLETATDCEAKGGEKL